MKTKALYAGTFDPITNGHHWIIDEAAELFDEVYVAVADNPEKRGKTMFSAEERVQMVSESCFGLEGVKVVTYSGVFTVDFARGIGATHLIRGIRNETDFGAEQAIRHVNEDIRPEIKTLFMVPPRHLSEVSSSMVKGLVGFRGWRDVVERYVQCCVVKRFQARNLTNCADVMERLGATPQEAKAAAEYLRGALEYGRWYHKELHVLNCLELLGTLVSDRRVSPQDFDRMAAALWFHDAVYDPKALDNEERSAGMFRRFSGSVDTETDGAVQGMILATKNHGAEGDYPTLLVNDIDMAILGAEEKEFNRYEVGIRKEYDHVPDVIFYPARKKFLLGCLESCPYHTDKFREMFGEKAHDNISRLLATSKYANA